MPWYHYLLELLAGMLLTNGIPHFVQGLSGSSFQSPFAKPPGVGESSALVNVYWGAANLGGGTLLLVEFMPASYVGWLVFAVGALVMATQLASHFAKVRGARRAA